MIKRINAFSLIELSIIIIIIGFILSGIIGSISLINSARIRGVINEIKQIQQSIYILKSFKGRLPGDIDTSGKIGGGGGQIYTDSSFGGNYISINKDYGLPKSEVGPFVDLYLEGITNFEPKKDLPQIAELGSTNGGSPKSKYISILYRFWRSWSTINKNSLFYGTSPDNYIDAKGEKINPIFLKTLDTKIDDGKYNKGKVRDKCQDLQDNDGTVKFEEAIYCNEFFIRVE